jgi:hypothetical protein
MHDISFRPKAVAPLIKSLLGTDTTTINQPISGADPQSAQQNNSNHKAGQYYEDRCKRH